MLGSFGFSALFKDIFSWIKAWMGLLRDLSFLFFDKVPELETLYFCILSTVSHYFIVSFDTVHPTFHLNLCHLYSLSKSLK